MKSFVFGFELKTFRIYFELYFYYLILFQVLDKVLNLSKGVSDKLQSEDLEVVSGCDRVEDLHVAIEEHRIPRTSSRLSGLPLLKHVKSSTLKLRWRSVKGRYRYDWTTILRQLCRLNLKIHLELGSTFQ